MTFREFQKLISKQYGLDAATANETASALIQDGSWDFEKMTPEEVSIVLSMLENKGA